MYPHMLTEPMSLIHGRLGKQLSWSLYEQNLLLTEGWHEVSAAEYRRHPAAVRSSISSTADKHR